MAYAKQAGRLEWLLHNTLVSCVNAELLPMLIWQRR